MSLRKAIEYGKEHRKPYYGSKDFDKTCRNHGGCPWCEENRNYKNLKRKQAAMERFEEFIREDIDILCKQIATGAIDANKIKVRENTLEEINGDIYQ